MRVIYFLLFFITLPLFAQSSEDGALAALTLRANNHDPLAQYQLATHYLNATPESEQNNQARYWLELAAENGHLGAQTLLAQGHESGSFGGAPDPQQALNWYTSLALQGDAEAQLAVGRLLERYGAQFSPTTLATIWYRHAAKLNPKAQKEYSRLLEQAFNTQRSKQLADNNKPVTREQEQAAIEADVRERATHKAMSTNPSSFGIPTWGFWLAGLLTTSLVAIVAIWRVMQMKATQAGEQREQSAELRQIQHAYRKLKQQNNQLIRERQQSLEQFEQQQQRDSQLALACALLGYEPDNLPSLKAVKSRYKLLSKVYHPDLHGSDAEMRKLNLALKQVAAAIKQTPSRPAKRSPSQSG